MILSLTSQIGHHHKITNITVSLTSLSPSQLTCYLFWRYPRSKTSREQTKNQPRKSKQCAGHRNKTVLLRILSFFPELSFDFQIDIPLLPKLPCFVTVSNSHIYTSLEFRKSEINDVLLGLWQNIVEITCKRRHQVANQIQMGLEVFLLLILLNKRPVVQWSLDLDKNLDPTRLLRSYTTFHHMKILKIYQLWR